MTDNKTTKPPIIGGLPSASSETTAPYPKMDFCQKIHQLVSKSNNTIELQTEVFEKILTELENPSLYRRLKDKLYHSTDDAMSINNEAAKATDDELNALDEKNQKYIKELLIKVDEAKESAGDMEVMDARVEIARFCAKSMSEHDTLDAYNNVITLAKISSGKKIDSLMECARITSFYNNIILTDEYIEKANKLANDGGGADWDRRNRLKIYRALQYILHRNMDLASKLLLDCIATFSCSEICNYTEFILYTVLTNLLHLPRTQLKEKIIDGPEIVSVATEIPIVVSIMQCCFLFM